MGLAYLLEPSFQIVDKSGNPLSNGFIEVYISGTSTKYYCYSDFNGSLHPFRIPLDAIGSNIILASSELIYDVFIYNSFGTMVMSRHRVAPSTSTITSGNSYIIVEGTEGQIAVQSTGSTDITYKVGLDDAIINELSDIHNDISSTSSYLDDKIDNLDIHNITIEQSGNGNAYTSFTKNGDTYTFNKDAVYLPSANAPVVIAGENVEVSSANVNGKMQYTIKANPAGNVTNLISTDETISISSTSVGNDVTYDLSIGSLSGKANYAICSVNDYPLTANHFGGVVFDNYTTKGITWSTVDNRLEIPSSIKLLDVNVECELLLSNINNVTYGNLELGIYQDWGLLEEKKFEIDLSKERHFVNFTTKMLDVENLQFTIKSPANATANIRVGVNDESNAIGNGGSTYYAGLNIEISDNVIIGRDWTPELNTKLDTSAFTLPTSANWNNTYNTVQANSAAWSNPAITDIELYSSDGSLLINNTSSGDNVSYDLQLNDKLSAKNYFVTDFYNPYVDPPPIQTDENDNVYFTTSEPKTDLSSNTDQYGDQWLTTGINIPKEMELFDIKFGLEPYKASSMPRILIYNFHLYMDDTYIDSFRIQIDDTYPYDHSNYREKNFLIYNPMSADSVLSLKCYDTDWNGWAKININDETYRSIGTSADAGQGIPDNYNSLYDTVSSNSATWNENGGTTYSAGPNINITNNTISGKDWTPELNTKLNSTAFTLPTSANWDNTYNTVQANSATWNEILNYSPIINHSQVASGTLVVNNNEYINVSALDVSGVLTVKAMNTSVINDEPIRQCGGTLLFNTQPSAVNFVDSNDSLLPNIVLPTTFSGDKYQFTIINGVVACQEIN